MIIITLTILNEKITKGLIIEINKELYHQNEKYGNQNLSVNNWFLILSKQIGDLSKTLLHVVNIKNILKEVNQCITVLIQIFNILQEFI